MHNEEVVDLIEKVILNPMLVGEEKSSHLSKDIDTFWNEYDNFVNMRGCFSHQYMQLGVMASRRTDGIRDIPCKGRRYWASWHV